MPAEKSLWSLLHRYHKRVLDFDEDLNEHSQKKFRECLLAEAVAQQPPSEGTEVGDASSRAAKEWKSLFDSWKRDRRLTSERANLDSLFAEIMERLKKESASSAPLQGHGVQALIERLVIIGQEKKEGLMPASEVPSSAVEHHGVEGEIPTYAEINQLMRMIDETRMTLEYLEEHLELITGGCIPESFIAYARRRMRGR